MRLLLINPRFPESLWSFRWAIEEVLVDTRALNPPLELATLAALCPPHWDARIVDENVEPFPLEPEADLIGICGMGVQFARQKLLLGYYRSRGSFVVAGGSYASLCPEKYSTAAHTVVAGESEYIWPQFCADFERGAAKALYREAGTVELTDSPTPRFDLLKLDRYNNATLQFSRGCPYRCDFCDIIVMFGRKPRCKSPKQAERELDALRRLGARNVFFVDDNLIGNRPFAKRLLRTLPVRAPSCFPLVIADWITGLAMRHYVERRFAGAAADASTLERCVTAVRRAIARDLAAGRVTLSFVHALRPDLAVTLNGLLERRFFKRAGPELERLLARTHAGVTLRIEGFHAQQREHFNRLLRRLARYGDRVSVVIDAKLRALLPVDSSIFNLVLPASGE
jgi:hypothetical protein